jgi:hypothetical protein
VLGIVWDFAGLPVPVLVTQYEEFGSLSGLLDNSTVVIDMQRRLDIVNDVANALRYLYAQVINTRERRGAELYGI